MDKKEKKVLRPFLPAGPWLGQGMGFLQFSRRIWEQYSVFGSYDWGPAVMAYLFPSGGEEGEDKRPLWETIQITLNLLKVYFNSKGVLPGAAGNSLVFQANIERIIDHYLERIRMEDDRAFRQLGSLYLEGRGLSEKVLEKSFERLEKNWLKKDFPHRKDGGKHAPFAGLRPQMSFKVSQRMLKTVFAHGRMMNGKERFQQAGIRQQRIFYTEALRNQAMRQTKQEISRLLGRSLDEAEGQKLSRYFGSMGVEGLVRHAEFDAYETMARQAVEQLRFGQAPERGRRPLPTDRPQAVQRHGTQAGEETGFLTERGRESLVRSLAMDMDGFQLWRDGRRLQGSPLSVLSPLGTAGDPVRKTESGQGDGGSSLTAESFTYGGAESILRKLAWSGAGDMAGGGVGEMLRRAAEEAAGKAVGETVRRRAGEIAGRAAGEIAKLRAGEIAGATVEAAGKAAGELARRRAGEITGAAVEAARETAGEIVRRAAEEAAGRAAGEIAKRRAGEITGAAVEAAGKSAGEIAGRVAAEAAGETAGEIVRRAAEEAAGENAKRNAGGITGAAAESAGEWAKKIAGSMPAEIAGNMPGILFSDITGSAPADIIDGAPWAADRDIVWKISGTGTKDGAGRKTGNEAGVADGKSDGAAAWKRAGNAAGDTAGDGNQFTMFLERRILGALQKLFSPSLTSNMATESESRAFSEGMSYGPGFPARGWSLSGEISGLYDWPVYRSFYGEIPGEAGLTYMWNRHQQPEKGAAFGAGQPSVSPGNLLQKIAGLDARTDSLGGAFPPSIIHTLAGGRTLGRGGISGYGPEGTRPERNVTYLHVLTRTAKQAGTSGDVPGILKRIAAGQEKHVLSRNSSLPGSSNLPLQQKPFLQEPAYEQIHRAPGEEGGVSRWVDTGSDQGGIFAYAPAGRPPGLIGRAARRYFRPYVGILQFADGDQLRSRSRPSSEPFPFPQTGLSVVYRQPNVDFQKETGPEHTERTQQLLERLETRITKQEYTLEEERRRTGQLEDLLSQYSDDNKRMQQEHGSGPRPVQTLSRKMMGQIKTELHRERIRYGLD